MSDANFELDCIHEEKLGQKWMSHWAKVWPSCKRWYMSEGLLRRPGYQTCLSAIRTYMPELEELYMDIVTLTGGSDIAGRFLSLYNPPAYMAGCSQAIWDKDEVFLIRNYDYSPELCDKTLFYSNWLKPVIGMLDCAWGLLDGINSDGLVASLNFGGKKDVGEGFGAPMIVRYILETSATVAEAKIRIAQLPCHMSYNITLLDTTGHYTKVFLSPGQKPIFQDDPVSTNHQENIHWLEYAEFSKTIERYNFLNKKLLEANLTKEQLVSAFLKKPLFKVDFENLFGTVYTCLYHPTKHTASYLWQEQSITQSFDHFEEKKMNITIKEHLNE